MVATSHNWSADQWESPLQHSDGVVQVNNSDRSFEVGLDCAYFAPDEIDICAFRHPMQAIHVPLSGVHPRRPAASASTKLGTTIMGVCLAS